MGVTRHEATAGFSPGSGWSYGTVASAGPAAARLSFAADFGVAVTDYRGQVARAESRAVDLGLLGVGLSRPGCDGSDPAVDPEYFPQPLKTTSTEDGSEQGKEAVYQGTPPGSPVEAGIGKQQVWATGDPSGRAVSTVAPFGIPGVVEVGGGRTESWTGVEDGAVRRAEASVEIPRVELGGGAVTLEGLRWEVSHRSGDGDETGDGVFTIGRVLVAGQEAPGPALPEDTPGTLAALNELLAPTGLVLEPPVLEHDDETVTLTPLVIGVVRSQLGGLLFGTPLEALHPARERLTEGLLSADCRFGTAILAGDIVLGVPAGSGRLTVALGGAAARTGASAFQPLPDFPGFRPGEATPAVSSSGSRKTSAVGDPATSPGSGETDGSGGDAGVPAGPEPEAAAGAPATLVRAGRGLVPVLLGLLGVAGVMAADGYRIRLATGGPLDGPRRTPEDVGRTSGVQRPGAKRQERKLGRRETDG